jgi:hypothetical protein
MADLKEIRGTRVEKLDTNPTTPGYNGQLFYNTVSNNYKVNRAGTAADGSWASGGNLNTARDGMYGGAGTQTAGLVTGGRDGPGASVAVNESYDGTSWTELSDLNTARQFLTTFGYNRWKYSTLYRSNRIVEWFSFY